MRYTLVSLLHSVFAFPTDLLPKRPYYCWYRATDDYLWLGKLACATSDSAEAYIVWFRDLPGPACLSLRRQFYFTPTLYPRAPSVSKRTSIAPQYRDVLRDAETSRDPA